MTTTVAGLPVGLIICLIVALVGIVLAAMAMATKGSEIELKIDRRSISLTARRTSSSTSKKIKGGKKQKKKKIER